MYGFFLGKDFIFLNWLPNCCWKLKLTEIVRVFSTIIILLKWLTLKRELYSPSYKFLLRSPDTPKMVKYRIRHVSDTDTSRYVPIRVSEKYRAINIYFFEKQWPIRVGYFPIRVSEKYRAVNIYFLKEKNDRYVSDTTNLYFDTAYLYSDTYTSVLHISFKKKKK